MRNKSVFMSLVVSMLTTGASASCPELSSIHIKEICRQKSMTVGEYTITLDGDCPGIQHISGQVVIQSQETHPKGGIKCIYKLSRTSRLIQTRVVPLSQINTPPSTTTTSVTPTTTTPPTITPDPVIQNSQPLSHPISKETDEEKIKDIKSMIDDINNQLGRVSATELKNKLINMGYDLDLINQAMNSDPIRTSPPSSTQSSNNNTNTNEDIMSPHLTKPTQEITNNPFVTEENDSHPISAPYPHITAIEEPQNGIEVLMLRDGLKVQDSALYKNKRGFLIPNVCYINYYNPFFPILTPLIISGQMNNGHYLQIVIQARPVPEKDALLFRPHFALQNQNVSIDYNINFINYDSGEAKTTLNGPYNVNTHPGEGGLIASPNNMPTGISSDSRVSLDRSIITNGRNDFTNSNMTLVTYHILLEDINPISQMTQLYNANTSMETILTNLKNAVINAGASHKSADLFFAVMEKDLKNCKK